MSEADDSGRKSDVVLLHSPTESGDGIRVLRKRDDAIEVGELRPMRQGQPIHGDVVRLTQRKEHTMLYDCEVVLAAKKPKELAAKSEGGGGGGDESGDDDADTSGAAGASAASAGGHKGPARVTSEAYRGGWEAIFGGRQGSNESN